MIAYFQIPASTEFYQKLKSHYDECNRINKATAEYVSQFNEHGTYIPYSSASGSIASIGFKPDQAIPKGWIQKGAKDGFVFFRPNGRSKACKALLEEFKNLEQRSIFQLSDIFDYHECPKQLYPSHYIDFSREILVVNIDVEHIKYWKSKPSAAVELTAMQYIALKRGDVKVKSLTD